MTDVKWIIDEQRNYVFGGGCPYAATVGILNALSLMETETMMQYQYAQSAIQEFLKNDPQKAEVLCRMLKEIIGDEGDHDLSFKKAAAIISGYKEAKPSEYNNAEKGK